MGRSITPPERVCWRNVVPLADAQQAMRRSPALTTSRPGSSFTRSDRCGEAATTESRLYWLLVTGARWRLPQQTIWPASPSRRSVPVFMVTLSMLRLRFPSTRCAYLFKLRHPCARSFFVVFQQLLSPYTKKYCSDQITFICRSSALCPCYLPDALLQLQVTETSIQKWRKLKKSLKK